MPILLLETCPLFDNVDVINLIDKRFDFLNVKNALCEKKNIVKRL